MVAAVATLTAEQRAAAHDSASRVVIVAPPGSGKTATLAARCGAVADRSSSVPGTRAVAITFTCRAAAELKERAPEAQASTFHGLAVRLKRLFERDPFSVYDSTDAEDIACLVGEELGILKPGGYVKRNLAAAKVLKDAAGRRRYVQMLRQARAVDYQLLVDDGLAHAARPHAHDVFSSSAFLLDEMQDTDPVQMELVRRLDPAAVTIVGDVRQSIYSFRGAAPEILLDAYRRPELGWSPHSLTLNFRSVPPVVALGNKIARGMTFEAPEMVAMRPSMGGDTGVSVAGCDDSDEEAALVAAWAATHAQGWESGAPRVFVLSRNWRGLARTREALTAAGTAHAYLGDAGDFWQAEPVKMLLRAASLALNPHQDPWTRMLANWPTPRCSAVELAKAAEVAAREDAPLCHVLAARMPAKFGFWAPEALAARGKSGALLAISGVAEDLRAVADLERTGRSTKAAQAGAIVERVNSWALDAEDGGLPAFMDWLADGGSTEDAPESPIHLSTVHSVKGLEAPAVAVVGLDAKGFHESGPEERRLFFVSCTRARDRLLLTRSETHHGDDVGPSSFWTEAAAP